MKHKLERRLQELRAEFDSGQKVAAELEAKQINIRNTLLRISGAIQVLEELLKEERTTDNEIMPATNGVAGENATL